MQLSVKTRTETGKGSARKLRNVGMIPAIFYGPETEPTILSVDHKKFEKMVKGKVAENFIFDLEIESEEKTHQKKAILKEIQKDPVTRDLLHLDFYEVLIGKEIEFHIPILLVNIPVGVTQGGILDQQKRKLKISCKPEELLEEIECDVSGLDIGQSIHIKDISLPPGLRILEDQNLTVALVASPAVASEEEEKVEDEEITEESKSEETGGEEKS